MSRLKYDSVREAKPGEVSFGPNNLRLTPPLYPPPRQIKDRHPRQMQQTHGADAMRQKQQGDAPEPREDELGDLLKAFA